MGRCGEGRRRVDTTEGRVSVYQRIKSKEKRIKKESSAFRNGIRTSYGFSSFTFIICDFNRGISSLTAFQTFNESMLKYAWISLSLIPAISFQGISGYRIRIVSGICFAASPIISMHWIVAKWVFSSF